MYAYIDVLFAVDSEVYHDLVWQSIYYSVYTIHALPMVLWLLSGHLPICITKHNIQKNNILCRGTEPLFNRYNDNVYFLRLTSQWEVTLRGQIHGDPQSVFRDATIFPHHYISCASLVFCPHRNECLLEYFAAEMCFQLLSIWLQMRINFRSISVYLSELCQSWSTSSFFWGK